MVNKSFKISFHISNKSVNYLRITQKEKYKSSMTFYNFLIL